MYRLSKICRSNRPPGNITMLRGNNGISRFLLIHPTNTENDYALEFSVKDKNYPSKTLSTCSCMPPNPPLLIITTVSPGMHDSFRWETISSTE
jgi:hypothetical protein